ncbi:MAG: histidine phosphatase family protein [Pseudomonadota bacterium]
MGELLFVRHGQASFGVADYDKLSPLGWQQARWLGEMLAPQGGFDHVVMGTHRRHRETAEALLAAGMPAPEPVIDPGLDEMDYDQLYTDAEAAAIFPHLDPMMAESFRVTMPLMLAAWEAEGFATAHERYADFRARIVGAVQAASQPGRRALIVSSGGPKAVTLREVLGLDSARMSSLVLQILNSSVTRFDVRDDGLHLAEFNAVPHLADADRAHARTHI